MKQTDGASTSASLRKLCERVGQWRAERDSRKARVPEALWHAAVEVARVEGVYATASALHFNYSDLKQRVMQAGDTQAGRQDAAPTSAADETTFVEVQAPTPAVACHAASRVVVELFHPGGDRMRIEAEPRDLDLSGLAHAFWGR